METKQKELAYSTMSIEKGVLRKLDDVCKYYKKGNGRYKKYEFVEAAIEKEYDRLKALNLI